MKILSLALLAAAFAVAQDQAPPKTEAPTYQGSYRRDVAATQFQAEVKQYLAEQAATPTVEPPVNWSKHTFKRRKPVALGQIVAAKKQQQPSR